MRAPTALAVADRLLGLIEQPPRRRRGPAVPPSLRDGPDPVESVSFAYPGRPGFGSTTSTSSSRRARRVALVGPSGGGKSTLASLLLASTSPDGRILVGGLDLADVRPGGLAGQIAWVPQARRCFAARSPTTSGSAPIVLGRGRARRRRGWPAPTPFVARLPGGYATDVGEGFLPLSTGERQRIALARAFLRDAPLVVLDEPTANLDPQNARLVADAVERLRPGRTVLLIAHDAQLARLRRPRDHGR